MNKEKTKTQDIPYWVGIDWGESEHAVSIVDDARALHAQFKVDASLDGLHRLSSRLRAFGAIAGIAIEATCNPIVQYLYDLDYTIYPINPKMSKNWSASNSVSAIKNDERDGLMLGMELSRRHESLRTLDQNNPAALELAGLCEKQRNLIDQRTALLQRLKSTLRQYYPGAIEFFSDWSSPAAWRFLNRFPRPKKLVGAHKSTLIKFLKANRIGLRPIWLERIENRSTATQWPIPADSLALEAMALACAAQLQALDPCINKLDRLIAERASALPQTRLLRSLPGAADRLAPALAAMTAALASEQNMLQALRGMSGVAPVQNQSGSRNQIKIRRRCNKYWRNILHLFAQCSTNFCAWAKAFYDLCRGRGDKHATALRKLADKWLKIMHRMLANGEPYDDERYVEALRKSGSPTYQKLCEKTCG